MTGSKPRSRKGNKAARGGSKRSGTWQLQAARANLSEVVDAAERMPQHITRNGKPVAVVLSHKDYSRLTKPRLNLVEFFQQSPLAAAMAEGDVAFDRDQGPLRDIDL
jgi:antitoxin Phd